MSDITTDLYASDLATFVSDLPGATKRTFLDALNEAGTASFELLNTDADAALIAFQSFVNFKLYGEAALTMICEQRDKAVLDRGEEDRQRTIWSGRGHLAALERARLFPALGAGHFPTEESRFFGWTAPSYDISAYGAPTTVCDVATAKTSWPLPWDEAYPDDTAQVIWASDGTITSAGVGHCWFWGVFNLGIAVPAKAFLAADNGAQLHIDGVRLVDTGIFDVGRTFSANMALSAGLHRVAVQCENLSGGGANPAGFACSIYGTDVSGNLTGLVFNSFGGDPAFWKILEYEDAPPPLPFGAVLNQVLDEWEARGGLVFSRTWTDTEDTNGETWPGVAISAQVGIDYFTLFHELSATYMDFSMTPGYFELNAYLKGTRNQ